MMKLMKDRNRVLEMIGEGDVSALGVINHIKNNEAMRLYLDDFENPKMLIVTNGYFYLPHLFVEDEGYVEKIIDVINEEFYYGYELGMPGVPLKYFESMKQKKTIQWFDICEVYYYDGETFEIEDHPYAVDTLSPSEAKFVHEFYPYKHEESLYRVRKDIEERDTVCLRDEDGAPIVWCMVHDDGTMGFMHTMEAYRTQGLGQIVSKLLINKLLAKGERPYIHIVEGNWKSVKLSESLGFKFHSKIAWFGIAREEK